MVSKNHSDKIIKYKVLIFGAVWDVRKAVGFIGKMLRVE